MQEQPGIPEEQFNHFKMVATSLFSSKNGKEFLEVLENIFIKQPVWNYEAKESFAAFREGQNDMVRNLIKWSTPSQTLEK